MRQPGDQDAARTLLQAVTPGLLRVARGVLGARHPDVPDVCQEAAVALLAALPAFRAECTVMHFACRIGVLTAMNARRRERLGGRVSAVEEQELLDDAPSPVEAAEAARRRRAVRQLLDELPEAQAEVLALHVMLGYTVQETSAAVAAPIDTVRSRLRRALSALRERLRGEHGLLEVVRGNT
jgi:RNA polymerase sigma factor (sigma-70 family)